jgi:hypothetical protein
VTSERRQVIVVDAANVVGSRPDGWWRDRAGAARRLLRKLAILQHNLPDTADVVVILEGAAKSATSGPEAPNSADLGSLRVVLAKASGDDTIVDVTTQATADTPPPASTDTGPQASADTEPQATAGSSLQSGADVIVVTADRGLRQRVEAVGARTVGPRWLTDQLDPL